VIINVNVLGVVAGLCFALCGVPAAWATIRAGRSVGTPISTAWLILGGSISMFSGLFLLYGFNAILTANYAVEIASWAVITYFHYFPRVSALEHIMKHLSEEDYGFRGMSDGAPLPVEDIGPIVGKP
jgi:hypothetical protein